MLTCHSSSAGIVCITKQSAYPQAFWNHMHRGHSKSRCQMESYTYAPRPPKQAMQKKRAPRRSDHRLLLPSRRPSGSDLRPESGAAFLGTHRSLGRLEPDLRVRAIAPTRRRGRARTPACPSGPPALMIDQRHRTLNAIRSNHRPLHPLSDSFIVEKECPRTQEPRSKMARR